MDIESWFNSEVINRLSSDNPFHFGDLKKNVHTSGMYVIYFPNFGIYVGSTSHLYRRRIKHLADMKNGSHENRNVQKAYDSSPDKKFLFIYIQTKTRDEAVRLEQLAIDYFQDDELLCNFGRNAWSPNKGMIFTEERIAKQRDAARKRYNNDPDIRRKLAESSRKNWTENRETLLEKALPNLAMGAKTTSLPVCVDGEIHPSISAAARHHGISLVAAQYRLKSDNFKNWTKQMAKESMLVPEGLVLYIDGSCQPNPGNGGWGMHGYAYSNEVPKKGSGCSTDYVTNLGYVLKDFLDQFRKGENAGNANVVINEMFDLSSMKDGTFDILQFQLECQDVTPLWYVDAFAGTGNPSTNNVGEARGLLEAFEFILKQPDTVKDIFIFSDSTYALTGFRDYLDGWAKNNWLKRDGQPIKSMAIWKRIYDIRDAVFKDRNINLMWLPGHSIFLGNQMADANANLGKNCTLHQITEATSLVQPAQGYWKDQDADKHPLFVHQKVIFNGDFQFHTPGYYHMAAVDKDLGVFGKKLSDSSYSIVRTTEPVKSVDDVIKIHCDMGEDNEETVVLSLASLYRASVYDRLQKFGKVAFYQPLSHINNLISVDKVSVTEVVDPPKRAQDAIIALNSLDQSLIDVYDNGNKAGRFVANDLTDLFFEDVEVKKKKDTIVVKRLKESIKPGMNSIKTNLLFKTIDGDEHTLPTILTFGIDLPDRNTYKKIEELEPKVTVYTYQESQGVFRYFTVVQAGNDVGAYCGSDSNIRLAKLPK